VDGKVTCSGFSLNRGNGACVNVRRIYGTEFTRVEYITPILDNTSMPVLSSLAGFHGNLMSI